MCCCMDFRSPIQRKMICFFCCFSHKKINKSGYDYNYNFETITLDLFKEYDFYHLTFLFQSLRLMASMKKGYP